MTSDFYQNTDWNYAGPDTATAGTVDPFYTNEFANDPLPASSPTLGMGSTPAVDAFYSNQFAAPPSTGGAASNTPAQSSASGSGLLGWLGLASNVANTAANAARTGSTTRPGVNTKPASTMGAFGTITTTTLLVIVAVFIGVVFLLRKR